MNIEQIIRAAQKPEIYTPGTALMWVDEYISTQLLEIHLSQDIELASRKKSTITSTIEWILQKVPGNGLNILDLGCGPGLYTEQLAQRGHIVTGMDFSSNSINYAKESASNKELDITYNQLNYLELEDKNKYDLVLLIFTDFGVLAPDQREILLSNIYRALKPGGTFVFDVLNDNYDAKVAGSNDWELSEKGFWRDSPYLALSESFYYEKQKVTLNQHIVIDQDRGAEVYRFWMHNFSNSDLGAILLSAGFSTTEYYDGILPDSDMYSSSSVTFCMTTK